MFPLIFCFLLKGLPRLPKLEKDKYGMIPLLGGI